MIPKCLEDVLGARSDFGDGGRGGRKRERDEEARKVSIEYNSVQLKPHILL